MLTDILTTYSGLFLKKLDKNRLRIFLESSPQYPNLLCVVRTLRYVGIDAKAGQCEMDYLKNMRSPFLMHLVLGNQERLVIARWNAVSDSLDILNPKKDKWENTFPENFLKSWDGIVIYTNQKTINKTNFHLPLSILLLVVGLCISSAVCGVVRIETIYYLPIIFGAVIGCCLHWRSELSGNHIIDAVCHATRLSDCERVENSGYSSIAGIRMSSLAAAYFISQFACVAISCLIGYEYVLPSLYAISAAISVPVIIYSAYGQFKMKRICPLCIIVILCIVSEALLFILCIRHPVDAGAIALFGGIFLAITIMMQCVCELRHERESHLAEHIKLLRLKRKAETLRSESIGIMPLESPMRLGRQDSKMKVTTVVSPSCGHCRKVISEIAALLKRGVDFRWEILPARTRPGDSETIDDWIKRYLDDKERFFEILLLWSKGVGMPRLINSRQDDEGEMSNIGQLFKRQVAALNLSGFPRIILNDRLLSTVYTTNDVEFILADLNST